MRLPSLIAVAAPLAAAASAIAPAAARAQSNVPLPVAQNLHGWPEQPGDVVLDVSGEGTYAVNGTPVPAAELAGLLTSRLRATRDHVVYIRGAASLPISAIDSAAAIAARASACVASLVATPKPGTLSRITADAGSENAAWRAIDVQLPLPRVSSAVMTQQQFGVIVLEVLADGSYRINTQPVSADDLPMRLRQIYSPRPVKMLYVRAEASVAYQDVVHALALARDAGVWEIVSAPRELVIRDRLPAIDLSVRVTERDDAAAERIDGNIGRCRRGDVYGPSAVPGGGRSAGGEPRVFFEFQVEKPVRHRWARDSRNVQGATVRAGSVQLQRDALRTAIYDAVFSRPRMLSSLSKLACTAPSRFTRSTANSRSVFPSARTVSRICAISSALIRNVA